MSHRCFKSVARIDVTRVYRSHSWMWQFVFVIYTTVLLRGYFQWCVYLHSCEIEPNIPAILFCLGRYAQVRLRVGFVKYVLINETL